MEFNTENMQYYEAQIKLFDSSASIEYNYNKPTGETPEEFEARMNQIKYKIPLYETMDTVDKSDIEFAGTVIRNVCKKGISRKNIFVNMQPLDAWMKHHGVTEAEIFNEPSKLSVSKK